MDEGPITIESPATRTAVGDESVSQAVVEAVAEASGVSPMDLDAPLYQTVDPEALDRLFAPTNRWADRMTGRTTFPYCGYEVTVWGDGYVSVEELDGER